MQQNAYSVAAGVNVGPRIRQYDGRSPQLLAQGVLSERVRERALLLMMLCDLVQDLPLAVESIERTARVMLRVAFVSALGHQPQ